MRKDYCELVVIIDRSGSMSGKESDVEGGFRSFIQEQKALPGDASLTLAQFDDDYEIIFTQKPLSEHIPDYNLVPRGMTALLDAVGKTIASVGERLSQTPENDRPDKVLVIIMTDGMENASSEYRYDRIKQMIEHQKSVYQWEFIFMGADMDAISVANDIGISARNTVNAKRVKTGGMFQTASMASKHYRRTGSIMSDKGESVQDMYDKTRND